MEILKINFLSKRNKARNLCSRDPVQFAESPDGGLWKDDRRLKTKEIETQLISMDILSFVVKAGTLIRALKQRAIALIFLISVSP